jgi:hypothetical protein
MKARSLAGMNAEIDLNVLHSNLLGALLDRRRPLVEIG